MQGTKLPIMTWFKYLLVMFEDENLRDCAKYAGVSLKGSFYMRHKIMNALANEMDSVKLTGIAELDETSVHISYSGSPHTDEIQIACAADRQGNIFLKIAKVGTTTLSIENVKAVYERAIKGVSELCTYGFFAYRTLCKENGIEHHAFKKGYKGKRGVYHINHVNYIHSHIIYHQKFAQLRHRFSF